MKVPNLDDPQAVLYALKAMQRVGAQAHNVASEDGGMTGYVRDMLFSINSMVDAVVSLVEDAEIKLDDL